MSSTNYHEPLSLVIISSISIGVAAIFSAWILFDIITRRGWKSMMAVMIPVYVINALYLWPITMWTYLKYGRPPPYDAQKQAGPSCHNKGQDEEQPSHSQSEDHGSKPNNHNHGQDLSQMDHSQMGHSQIDHSNMGHTQHEGMDHAHMNHGGGDRPMFATVTIGVCHCGAGCVLGDIVGEWIVYGTGAAIGSPPRMLWVEFLVDFAFAFAFGIIFQYFSIAPMANDYGPKVLVRALKADALSLLFFEIGLFGWMAAFQIGIFGDQLPMNTVTYWWMMQIGMFIGHWTGIPINWWLMTKKIKEPCA